MDDQAGQQEQGAVEEQREASPQGPCPYLGLVDDPSTWCMFTTAAHRCYRHGGARPIALEVQRRLCLRSGYASCPVYLGAAAYPRPPLERAARRLVLWTAAVLVAVMLTVAGILVVTNTLASRHTRSTVQGAIGVTATATPNDGSPSPSATAPSATVPPTPSPTPPRIYIVQPGDSLSSIAARYGLDADTLRRLNGIPRDGIIYAGQQIRLR